MQNLKMLVSAVTALLSGAALAVDIHTKALPKVNERETPSGAAVTLVADGELTFVIVADKAKASKRGTVREGLQILNEAFLNTTGHEPTLLDAVKDRATWESAPAILLLGDSAAAREFGFDADALPDQGFLVSTFPRGIALIGNETIKVGQEPPAGLKDSRTLPNSVCYAAVDFCERFLDCRYYYPGEDGFIFPPLANLTIAPVAYDAAPHFNTRGNSYGFYCAMDTPEEVAKWTSLMGAATGGPDIKNRWRLGLTMELLGKHNPEPRALAAALPEKIDRIFYRSPGGHLWYSAENYYANYYDVFNLGKGGFTDILLEAWKAYYASNGANTLGGALKLLGQEWINFGVTDVYMNPEDCIADPVVKSERLITDEDIRRANEVDRRAVMANVYGRFYSNLCARLSKELPDKKLFILAYYNCKYAPTRYRLPENFDAIVCDGSLLSYVMDPRARQKSQALFKGWTDAMGGRAPGMAYLYSCSDPFGNGITPEYIGEAVKLLGDNLGRTGVFFDGTVNWHHFYGWYAGAHQQWDPDFDAVAAFDDMADRMFGKAAETMKAFHRRLRANCETYVMPTLFDKNLDYPLAEVDALETLLAEAQVAVGDDALAARRIALVAGPWPEIFRQHREKMAAKTEAEDGVYNVARRTSEAVDWSKIPAVPGSNGLKLVWDGRGLFGCAEGPVHYTLSSNSSHPEENAVLLDFDTSVPGFMLNFTDTFVQRTYKVVSMSPFGKLRLLGADDDPNTVETALPAEPLGIFDGDVTAIADVDGRQLTLANAKASYVHKFGLIAGSNGSLRQLQSGTSGESDTGFYCYANWLDLSVNGHAFGDVFFGAANLRNYEAGDRRGFEYALNFDGAKAHLRLFMTPRSSILQGELEVADDSPVTVSNATLRLCGIPSKLIRNAAAEPWPYARQLRTARRLLERPSDARFSTVKLDLDEDDGFFLAQDANYDGSADGRGLGPCLMLVDMSKVAKATTSIGLERREVDVSCTLKPGFGKVAFGVWEDRVHRHSNEEIYWRFREERGNFMSATPSTGTERVIDVPTGGTWTQEADVDAETAGDALVKAGGGTWIMGANGKSVGKSSNFSKLVIRAGTVEMGCSTGRFHPQRIEIGSGATLTQANAASYNGNGVTIDIAEGAVFDLNYTAPAFLAVTGRGLLKNPGGTLTADQLRFFAGSIYVDKGSVTGSQLTLADGEVHSLADCIGNFKVIEGSTGQAKVTFAAAETPLAVTTPLAGGMKFTVKRPLAVARFDLEPTTSLVLNDTLTLAGGIGTLGAQNSLSVETGVTNALNVTGGIHFGAYSESGTFGKDGNSKSRVRHWAGFYTGVTPLLDIDVSGGQLYLGNNIPRRIFMNGGRTWTEACYSYGAYSEYHVNGGRHCIKGDGSGQYNNKFTRSDKPVPYYVHEKGVVLQNIGQCSSGWYAFDTPISSGVTSGRDGGIAARGPAKLWFSAVPAVTGPFRAETSSLVLKNDSAATAFNAAPYKFGRGDFELGNCYLASQVAGTFALADGEGSRFSTVGAGTIEVTFGTKAASWTIGPEGAISSSLAREKGAMLSLWTGGDNTMTGTGPTVKVRGGVELNALGVTKQPVFHVRKYGSGSLRYAELMTYDDAKGFLPVDAGLYTEGMASGMEKLALVSEQTTLSANAQVPALKIDNASVNNSKTDAKAPLVIEAGKTLTVGDGVNPAVVIGNSLGYMPSIKGTGTLDFGTSEGVIALTYGTMCIGTRITGSNGLTVGSAQTGVEANNNRAELVLGPDNAYAGGTWISNADVVPTGDRSFSTGAVHLGEGFSGRGGAIVFDTPVTLANDIFVSGRGGGRSGVDAALQFNANATLTGNVVLRDITYVKVPSKDHAATFAGRVSGDWLVVMNTNGNTADPESGADIAFARDENGRVVLTGENDISNEVQIVRSTLVLRGETPSLGAAIVENDSGCLRFENTEPTLCGNTVYGSGVIQLAGAQVTFTDLLGQPGEKFTLDLDCRRPVINSLKGIGRITTSRTGTVHLSVLDGTGAAFAGEVPANVRIHGGGVYEPGFLINIR